MPSITYTLTESDLVEAQRSWYLASLRSGATAVKLICGIGIFAAAASIALPATRNGSLGGAFLFLAGYALVILVNWLLFARRARRSFAADRALRQPITASWDSDEISFSGARRFGRTAWTQFSRRIETPSLLLLCRSGRQFNIIPRHALDSPDGTDLLRHASGIPR